MFFWNITEKCMLPIWLVSCLLLWNQWSLEDYSISFWMGMWNCSFSPPGIPRSQLFSFHCEMSQKIIWRPPSGKGVVRTPLLTLYRKTLAGLCPTSTLFGHWKVARNFFRLNPITPTVKRNGCLQLKNSGANTETGNCEKGNGRSIDYVER